MMANHLKQGGFKTLYVSILYLGYMSNMAIYGVTTNVSSCSFLIIIYSFIFRGYSVIIHMTQINLDNRHAKPVYDPTKDKQNKEIELCLTKYLFINTLG